MCFCQPAKPLFVKSFVFLLNDIGNHFIHFPSLFPKALEYVLANGLLDTSNSKFFIDTNAVECLRNFAFECIDLFTNEMIYKTLEITETILGVINPLYADKLVEAIISIIGKLPQNEIFVAQRKIFAYILADFSASCPGNLEFKPVLFQKGIALMSAAFMAMQGSSSQAIWQNLSDIIVETVNLTLKGIPQIKQVEVLNASYLLLKRTIVLSSVFSDFFFPQICESVICNYTPGREEGISAIISGISILFSEPNTTSWLSSNYLQVFLKLRDSLTQQSIPETIEKFFDLQSKLFESGLAVFNNTLLETLQLAINLCSYLSDRSASRAFLNFCQLIFAKKTEELAPFALALTVGLVSSLNTISINAVQPLSNLFNFFKIYYQAEFEQGVSSALAGNTFQEFQEKDKERIKFCFLKTDASTVQKMKILVNSIINILKGRGTIELLIATEIAISSESIKAQVID